jgi:2',3'-cyclic-nucleotide 2'-phosphodiesterase (5'-nucleotidase family)
VRVLVTGSTRGEIAECGCRGAGPQGGLARRTVLLDSLRALGPTLVLDAGDFASIDPVVGALTTDSLAAYLARTGYHGVGLGERELLRPALLEGPLADRLVSANVLYEDETQVGPHAYRLVDLGGVRVGITSLIDPSLVADLGDGSGARATDPEVALRAVAAAMRREGATILVLLAHMGFERARELGRLGLCDLVVVGHEGGHRAAPRVDRGTAYVWTGDRGRYVAEAVLKLGREGPEELAGETHPLLERIPRDEEVLRWVEGLKGSIQRMRREHLLTKAIDRGLEPARASSECGRCHERELAQWKGTRHARAHETLVAFGMEEGDECLDCHGTAQAGKTPIPSVQCVACHPAGDGHPERGGRVPSDANCVRCHDGENSPGFDSAAAWRSIAHGG